VESNQVNYFLLLGELEEGNWMVLAVAWERGQIYLHQGRGGERVISSRWEGGQRPRGGGHAAHPLLSAAESQEM
jgi:hypothetical protein